MSSTDDTGTPGAPDEQPTAPIAAESTAPIAADPIAPAPPAAAALPPTTVTPTAAAAPPRAPRFQRTAAWLRTLTPLTAAIAVIVLLVAGFAAGAVVEHQSQPSSQRFTPADRPGFGPGRSGPGQTGPGRGQHHFGPGQGQRPGFGGGNGGGNGFGNGGGPGTGPGTQTPSPTASPGQDS
jgi:hypothetical protein